MKSQSLLRSLAATIIILLIPAAAMLFADDVQWGVADFAIMGVLLFGTALLLQWALARFTQPAQRLAAAVVIIGALLLVWVQLAVGIFS